MSPKTEKIALPEAKRANDYLIRAIHAYRSKIGLSQDDLGSRLNWSQGKVSKKLSEKNASAETLPTNKILTFSEACLCCSAMDSNLGDVLTEYSQQTAQNPAIYSKAGFHEDITINNTEIIPVHHEIIPQRYQSFPAYIFDSNDSLVNNISDPMFRYWFGQYHCYFYSTLSSEDTCFHGLLDILPSSNTGCCNVTFKFAYDKKEDHYKEYYGQLILSKKTDGAYCTLINHDDQGEITFLVMMNPTIKNTRICCVLAFVLTISGGKDTNRPCVERMIISREKLEGKNFELAKSHLLLNDKYIRISEDDFIKFLSRADIPEAFKKRFATYESPFDALADYTCKIAIIPETWVKSLPGFSEQQQQAIIDLMRLFSIAPRNNKIKQIPAEKDIFEMFKSAYSKDNLPTAIGNEEKRTEEK